MRICNCGSGLPSWWAKDARGIELARVCDQCEERKLAGYRPEVLTDSNYEADEDIEPEDDSFINDPSNFDDISDFPDAEDDMREFYGDIYDGPEW